MRALPRPHACALLGCSHDVHETEPPASGEAPRCSLSSEITLSSKENNVVLKTKCKKTKCKFPLLLGLRLYHHFLWQKVPTEGEAAWSAPSISRRLQLDATAPGIQSVLHLPTVDAGPKGRGRGRGSIRNPGSWASVAPRGAGREQAVEKSTAVAAHSFLFLLKGA